MASLPLTKLLILFLFIFFLSMAGRPARAQLEEPSLKLMSEGLDQWPSTMSLLEDFDDIEEDEDGEYGRRSLFWRRVMRYYISYGALSANRIPCPPRSGRSYYTHNCFKARGPVHPYTRGCSAITRCRR